MSNTISYPKNVDQPGYMNNTAFHVACQSKRCDIIDLLRLTTNADFNLLGEKDHSALIIAAGSNNLSTLSCILKNQEVDVNLKGFRGKSALIWASVNGH